ncbi:M1 family metallopeptidase [Terriglobus albidus]|uniref:M1 family metallopeptidase n=1 Tax=Terriglobus albidus TaxID=1592106 RepID=UPI0021DFA784|nr:M1 family metallopeptidase [Terriglobus albidus]
MRFRLFLFFAALSFITSVQAQRLPSNARPTHYTLTITPDLKAATFAGEESIDLTLDAPATEITLNAAEIQFTSVRASGQVAGVSLDDAKEQATFTFEHALPAGPVTLQIRYTGTLNDKLRGFYLSKTPQRSYGVTQFEPTDARRAFPSFDEPAMKATFDLELVLDEGDTAISNTQIVSDTPFGSGKHRVKFATTPKMSTYLVAFLVGEFACSTGKADGVPIRACSTPDKVKYTKYAVDAAQYILHYYNQYFGIPYPMPKLDMIALPDFEAGAMENFGCITYRETDLLVDAKNGSVQAKKNVAEVIAHEMAHQWFGDMVTMQWWDNLWLNEGFATWMEKKPLAAWHPEWNMQQERAAELNETLNYDSDSATRPIRATANTPDEINEMFDGIAYGKAGAVLAMVEHYVGPEIFRQGVHNYLAAHLYGNATAEDFWKAQTEVSHQPVDRIMESFIGQPGVPLLRFTDKAMDAPQSRFYLSPLAMRAARAEQVQAWDVPTCLKGVAADLCRVMEPDGANTTIPEPFFFANSGATGYYRATYSQRQYSTILQLLETRFSPSERILFLGEREALMRAGLIQVSDYLNLLRMVKKDDSAAVLETAAGGLLGVDARIASDEEHARLQAWICMEYRPVYEALGKPSKHDSFEKQNLRATLFGLLGFAGDKEIIAEAQNLMDQLFRGKLSVDPAMTGTALAIAARNGDPSLYEKVRKASQVVKDPGLKTDFLHTLARFSNPALVEATLKYAISGEVRTQDSWVLLAILLSRPETHAQTWTFIQENWKQVQATLTESSGARIVSAVGSFCTQDERTQVEHFFAEHKVDASERTLKKSLESIDACIALRKSQQGELARWLETNK